MPIIGDYGLVTSQSISYTGSRIDSKNKYASTPSKGISGFQGVAVELRDVN